MVFPMQETPERYITTSATGAKEPWEMVFERVFFRRWKVLTRCLRGEPRGEY